MMIVHNNKGSDMMKKRLISYKHNIKEIIDKRFNFMLIFIIFIFSVLSISLITLQIGRKEDYQEKLINATEKIIEDNSVPRGRIYDRNYNLLVDNIGKKTIYYKKEKGINETDEIKLSYEIAKIIDLSFEKLHITNLKEFWLANNKELGEEKITESEYQKYQERKLSSSDLQKLKIERITDEELSKYNDVDREAAYIYYLMNKGYAYDEKIIKDENVTDEEYAYISENASKYPGFNTKLDIVRKYIYGDILKGILGTVSDSNQGIPYELKEYYLSKGYALNDRVGLSNLEYQYEDLLKGKNKVYKLNSDDSLELLKNGLRGNDIVLSIDINLQKEVERIMEEEMIRAKKEANTRYYNKSYVVISDPNNGEILAYAAKQIVEKNGNYIFYDYSPYMATSSITVGSVIKGASMTVGYDTGAITIGTKMRDECIKLRSTPLKCSWTSGLGVLDDIGALRVSSNSYQFKIAMKVANVSYYYDVPFAAPPSAFETYRSTFKEYGLGVKTGIDLPFEGTGYKGGSNISGHLLDYAIGQYDTYTPLQLSQYINTIASSGTRIGLHFLKEVHSSTSNSSLGTLVSSYKPVIYNKVSVDDIYINRIRYGFREVVRVGLGKGYMGNISEPAGKTGTSQSFIDTNNDGKVDTETITNTFAGYYPANNPKMSIVVISPDVTYKDAKTNYRTLVNRRISSKISEKFFDIYK
jgi:cell division protein FtsI/penicillin-binding protein 2